MMSIDYKKYSLNRLDEWMCDAISTSEATPQEVYDTIQNVVKEHTDYHKKGLDYCTELSSLLTGHRRVEFDMPESTQYTDEELEAMCLQAEADNWRKNFQELKSKYDELSTLYENLQDELELRKKWNL